MYQTAYPISYLVWNVVIIFQLSPPLFIASLASHPLLTQPNVNSKTPWTVYFDHPICFPGHHTRMHSIHNTIHHRRASNCVVYTSDEGIIYRFSRSRHATVVVVDAKWFKIKHTDTLAKPRFWTNNFSFGKSTPCEQKRSGCLYGDYGSSTRVTIAFSSHTLLVCAHSFEESTEKRETMCGNAVPLGRTLYWNDDCAISLVNRHRKFSLPVFFFASQLVSQPQNPIGTTSGTSFIHWSCIATAAAKKKNMTCEFSRHKCISAIHDKWMFYKQAQQQRPHHQGRDLIFMHWFTRTKPKCF